METLNLPDNVWILISTALVLLMAVPGLAVFYGGLTRTKNVLNTILMVFVSFSVVSILWIFVGYSLVFGDTDPFLGNLKYFFLKGININDVAPSADNLYHLLFVFFQMTFAGITVALMAGAFIERMRFSAWIWFSILWGLLVYFPVAHWIWGGGWLSNAGTLDFAGGIVVHETSGLGALVGALVLGRRKEAVILPSNLAIVAIGTGLLWFGWFGFNGGSSLGINGQAVIAALNSTIAAILGGLVWMFLEWIKFGKPTSLGLFTGIIAGLATITPAAGFVGTGAAFIIGIIGGLVCFYAVVKIKNIFKYDDSLDVFGVHGVGGMVGAFLIALFANPDVANVKGLFFGSGSLIFPQLLGIFVVGVYTIIMTKIAFTITGKITTLRVSKEEEFEGLDETIHGERVTNEPIKI